jgi:hypothetical protein
MRYIGRIGASPMIAKPNANSTELAARTGRPPRLSISRPTRGDTSPATRRPSDTPPTTQPSVQPVSATIGSASTAGK